MYIFTGKLSVLFILFLRERVFVEESLTVLFVRIFKKRTIRVQKRNVRRILRTTNKTIRRIV